MKAAVLYGKEDVRIEERIIPEIDEGQVLIRVKAVGVCPTDVKAYYFGSNSISLPRILGHEVSGIVEKSKNASLRPGTRVNVAADVPCLKCERCRRGLHNLCENLTSLGVGVDGGYSEYMVVPESFVDRYMVIALADSISYEEATFIEPVAVSLHALSLISPRENDKAVIIGDGPNALIHLQLLERIFKLNDVSVIGLSESRLAVASGLGNIKAVNPSNTIGKISDAVGKSVDIIDVTVGNKSALDEAMEIMDYGTRMLVFGGSIKDTEIPVTMNSIHYTQRLYTGTTGTNLSHYTEAARIVNSGKLDLKSLYTKEFKLDQIKDAFEYSRNLSGLKGIIKP